MVDRENFKKVRLDKLTVGMHVVQLDIPWVDSPFLRHSKTIKSQQDIEALRKAGVKIVLIDTKKGLAPQEQKMEPPAAQKKEKIQEKPTAPAATPISQKPKKTSLQQELNAAQGIRNKVRKTVDNLYASFGDSAKIDTEALNPLIDQTLTSLERNNQALMSLVHLSKAAQKVADHTFSVFCLTLNICQQMELSAEEKEALGLAALLHEAGWSQLPLNLMGKRTAYTAVEQKLVEKHVDISVALLKKSNIDEKVLNIISQHHEFGDGSGYPKKLKQDQIDELAKVLIVADQYDESINHLADRPGMLPTNALRHLYKEVELGRLDKKAAAALIDSLGIYPVSSAVLLSTGEKAVVREVSRDAHLLPVVEVFYDRKGKVLSDPLLVDLSDQNLRKIKSVLDPSNPKDDPARRLTMEVE